MEFTEEMFEEFRNKFLSAKSYEDLMGKNGALKKLLGHGIEQLLEAEMSEHLGNPEYRKKLPISPVPSPIDRKTPSAEDHETK